MSNIGGWGGGGGLEPPQPPKLLRPCFTYLTSEAVPAKNRFKKLSYLINCRRLVRRKRRS